MESHLPPSVRFLTCTFAERKADKLIEKGTICKMARGRMVRWLAEHSITAPEDIRAFADLGYCYSESDSTENNFVFIREKA